MDTINTQSVSTFPMVLQDLLKPKDLSSVLDIDANLSLHFKTTVSALKTNKRYIDVKVNHRGTF